MKRKLVVLFLFALSLPMALPAAVGAQAVGSSPSYTIEGVSNSGDDGSSEGYSFEQTQNTESRGQSESYLICSDNAGGILSNCDALFPEQPEQPVPEEEEPAPTPDPSPSPLPETPSSSSGGNGGVSGSPHTEHPSAEEEKPETPWIITDPVSPPVPAP